MAANKLVQILLPTTAHPSGEQDLHGVFERLAAELTGRFGGVTSYRRAPAEGRWRNSAHDTDLDDITVVEVMVDAIDRAYWADVRVRLEKELSQDEIIIRCQPMELL